MPFPARLMWKLSIDIAERYGALLRRLLCSAERLRDSATARGLRRVNTPFSRSSALLVRITRADHRRVAVLPIPPRQANPVPHEQASQSGNDACTAYCFEEMRQ